MPYRLLRDMPQNPKIKKEIVIEKMKMNLLEIKLWPNILVHRTKVLVLSAAECGLESWSCNLCP